MKLFRIVQGLTLAICFSTFFSFPAFAAKQSWALLTPMQQEALAPLSQQWDTLPDSQQKRLLATARKYPKLTASQKQRYLDKLTEWSKLSPQQRDRAREKYKAYSKLPSDKREEIKRMVLQSEAEKSVPYANDYKDETPAPDEAGQ